jgi:hypothetical protein
MNRHMTYLACPYSHDDSLIREYRYEMSVTASLKLIQQNELVFSPITHCHPIAKIGELPKDWNYWKEFDTKMITICDSVTVLNIDGWKESEGVREEIKLAEKLNKQLRILNTNNWLTSLLIFIE